MSKTYLDGKVTVFGADCRDVLRTLPDNSVDACVTDPPYALVSIVKRFGKDGAAPAKSNGATGVYARASAGFMGARWDHGEVAFSAEIWAEVLRVLKPGGFCLAMGGDRTVHRLICAIEDAGFEIRGQLAWLYGSGMPKSRNVSKDIDRMAGAEPEVIGERQLWGSAATGGRAGQYANGEALKADGSRKLFSLTAPATEAAREWEGWGTALKPAMELIVMARKPLSEKSVAANVLKWGTGAINIRGCQVGIDTISTHSRGSNGAFPKRPGERTPEESGRKKDQRDGLDHSERSGRWPANLIHDGSDEVLAGFPVDNDGISAARYFYTVKADGDSRLGSAHPTVKPLDLIQYLVRLVCRKGGTVLDLFAGTGTTGEAAFREGCKAILIEREEAYLKDIERRMALMMEGRTTRLHASVKARGKAETPAPLFDWGS